MARTLVFDGVRMQVEQGVGEAVLALGLIVTRLRQPETVAIPALIEGRPVVWTGVLAPGTTLGIVEDAATPEVVVEGSRAAAYRISERMAALSSPLPLETSTDVEAWLGTDQA